MKFILPSETTKPNVITWAQRRLPINPKIRLTHQQKPALKSHSDLNPKTQTEKENTHIEREEDNLRQTGACDG